MASRRRRRTRQPKRIPWWRRVPHWPRRATGWVKTHKLGSGLILLVALNLLLWMGFVLPEYNIPPVKCGGRPLAISLRYPHYVAVRDEGFVEVGVHNLATQPISGTAVIVFRGDLAVHPVLAKTNALSFAALPPGGIMADRVRFTLNEPTTRWRGRLPFTVQVSGDMPCILGLSNLPLRLFPVPGLKTGLTTILAGTLGIVPLTGLLWEGIKKQLFPEEKK